MFLRKYPVSHSFVSDPSFTSINIIDCTTETFCHYLIGGGAGEKVKRMIPQKDCLRGCKCVRRARGGGGEEGWGWHTGVFAVQKLQ